MVSSNSSKRFIVLTIIAILWVLGGFTLYRSRVGTGKYIIDMSDGNVSTRIYHPPIRKEYSDVRASYVIGAYSPSDEEYNCTQYDSIHTRVFLKNLPNEFEEGDVIEVDGLKWRYEDTHGTLVWVAHKNPPGPFDSDGRSTNIHMYAEWIDDHPHLGLPPLPLSHKSGRRINKEKEKGL